ncbi:MAG: hypothetical protein VB015_02495 [Erysipelotrichaceae bacterium]|nr:hypothetical protein [Erysipelotrichaceae bacterium]
MKKRALVLIGLALASSLSSCTMSSYTEQRMYTEHWCKLSSYTGYSGMELTGWLIVRFDKTMEYSISASGNELESGKGTYYILASDPHNGTFHVELENGTKLIGSYVNYYFFDFSTPNGKLTFQRWKELVE